MLIAAQETFLIIINVFKKIRKVKKDIINVFTVTFEYFNASLLNKSRLSLS